MCAMWVHVVSIARIKYVEKVLSESTIPTIDEKDLAEGIHQASWIFAIPNPFHRIGGQTT